MTAISPDLLSAIADRARDPGRRTLIAGIQASAQPLDIGSLLGDFQRHTPPQAQGLAGAFDRLSGMLGGLGKTTMMGPDGAFGMGRDDPGKAQPLAQPPGQTALDAAEARIGRKLPEELRQLYAVGDGGFGPGEGLFPLAELVERYLDLNSGPFGPLGQPWPANLLPLFDENPVLVSIDLDSGAIVAWDPEEIEDEESEADWQRSFKREQASLGELMEQWLGRPVFEETAGDELQAMIDKANSAERLSPVTGLPMWLDDPVQQADAEISFLTHAGTETRASYGLPATGWEDHVRRLHGLL